MQNYYHRKDLIKWKTTTLISGSHSGYKYKPSMTGWIAIRTTLLTSMEKLNNGICFGIGLKRAKERNLLRSKTPSGIYV